MPTNNPLNSNPSPRGDGNLTHRQRPPTWRHYRLKLRLQWLGVLLLLGFIPLSAADLRVLTSATNATFHLGEPLEILATGETAKSLQAELSKGATSRKLTLYLGGVELTDLRSSYILMPSIPGKASNGPADSGILLRFIVDRNSEDATARRAWDAILRLQSTPRNQSGLEIALGIGTLNPLPVEGPDASRTIAFSPLRHEGRGYLAGAIMLGICLAILFGKSHMLRENGDVNNAFSLGRTQMAFWGMVVLSCFVGLACASACLEHIPDQVLILLGISAATGLGAAVMDGGRAPESRSTGANGKVGITDFFNDICVGDNGASFHRVQIVLWTIVLGIYFVSNVIHLMSMPEFSNTLLLLMGITNGTYLGFKTRETKIADPTLGVAPLELKDKKLETNITNGAKPYSWTVTSNPALTFPNPQGTLPEPGSITIGLPETLPPGTKITLTITDKNGATLTRSIDIKK